MKTLILIIESPGDATHPTRRIERQMDCETVSRYKGAVRAEILDSEYRRLNEAMDNQLKHDQVNEKPL